MLKTNFLARANVSDFSKLDLGEVISCSDESLSDWAKTVAAVFDSSDPQDQPDLLMMRSILVSEGMNLNDDIFLREELMGAKSTGAHKPVNIEHEDDNIVGHMLKTYAVDKQGRIIGDEEISIGEVDIVNEAVIYSYIFPDLAKAVKDLAAINELFVSVEAWFTHYDYSVGNKIISKNESTSGILEDVLRMNGGEGYFKGHKVGRVLRGIVFGGVGIVATPANPESLILNVEDTINPEAKIVETPDLVLSAHVVGFVNEGEEMKKEETSPEVSNICEASKSSEKTIKKDDNNAIICLVDRMVAMVKTAESVVEEIDSRIVVLGSKSKTIARKAQLAKAGLSKSKIVSRLDRIVDMEEQEFDDYLSDVSDIVRGSESKSEEEAVAADVEVQEVETPVEAPVEETAPVAEVEAEEVVSEEVVTEVVEEATVETVEEVAPEAVEIEAVEVEVEVAVVEEVVEEVVETSSEVKPIENDDDLAAVIQNSNAPEAIVEISEPPVVEDSTEEEIVEVDLENIVPVSPELTLPSSEEKKDFTTQLQDALVNILNQRR